MRKKLARRMGKQRKRERNDYHISGQQIMVQRALSWQNFCLGFVSRAVNPGQIISAT